MQKNPRYNIASCIQGITGIYFRLGTFNNVPCWGKQQKDPEDPIFYVFGNLLDGVLNGWLVAKTISKEPETLPESDLVAWAWEKKDGNGIWPLRLHLPYNNRLVSKLV